MRISAVFPLSVFVLLSLLPPGALAVPANDTVPAQWTMQSAVHYALRHNPDVQAARERMRAAEADLKAAQSAFYPQLSVSAGYNRTNNPMYSFGNILNEGMFNNSLDFNNPGTTDDLQAAGTVQYRIYNGGRDQANVRAADSIGEARVQENVAVRTQLEFNVVRAFCSIREAGDVVNARQKALQAISASLAVARARFNEGSLLKEEVLNLEVQQSRAEEQLIQAQHSSSLARRGFMRLLGLEGGNVTLAAANTPSPVIPATTVSTERPELRAMAAQIKALEAKVRAASAGNYPTADVFGSVQNDQGTFMDEGSGNSWSAGVKLNYNLYDGGRTSAQVANAEAQLREAKEKQHSLKLAYNLEMEKATLALHQADEQLKVAHKMVASATESARLSRLRFKEGTVLSSELIETEKRLTDARLSNSLAIAARVVAIADLRRCAGLPQFTEGK